MCNFENILQFLHFSIALDMSRIMHFLAEIMNPRNSAGGNFLIFSMSGLVKKSFTIFFLFSCLSSRRGNLIKTKPKNTPERLRYGNSKFLGRLSGSLTANRHEKTQRQRRYAFGTNLTISEEASDLLSQKARYSIH